MIKSGLAHADNLFRTMFKRDYNFYGTLSKVMLVWRERARNIFDEWSRRYGAVEAIKFARLVPPKCIRGRWGAVSRCREFIVKPPRDHLITVLTSVFTKKYLDKLDRKQAQGAKIDIDEIGAEDSNTYALKMGSWAKQVVSAIHDKVFWLMVVITQKLTGPLDHFAHYLAKKCASFEVKPLARIVWYKSAVFSADLNCLVYNDTWPEWTELMVDGDDELLSVAQNVAYKLACRNQADYESRITSRCKSDPLRLLNLCKQERSASCDLRRNICNELLGRSDDKLHPAAMKLKWLFHDDIEECARTGQLHSPLHSFIRLVACRWVADVQEIEGIHNIIQSICRRAPSISLPLLDARVGLRKALGLGNRAAKNIKWSQVMPVFDQLVEDGIAHFDGVPDVLANLSRWSRPIAAQIPATPRLARHLEICNGNMLSLPEFSVHWASCASFRLMRQMSEHEQQHGPKSENALMVFNNASCDGWVFFATYSRVGLLRRARLERNRGEIVSAALVEPADIQTSLLVLGSIFSSETVRPAVMEVAVHHCDAYMALSNTFTYTIDLAPPKRSNPRPRPSIPALRDAEPLFALEDQRDEQPEAVVYAEALQEVYGDGQCEEDGPATPAHDGVDAEAVQRQEISRGAKSKAKDEVAIRRCMPVLQAVDGNGSVEDEDIFVARQLQSLVHNHELEDAEPREPARDVPEVARVWKESCEQGVLILHDMVRARANPALGPFGRLSLVSFPDSGNNRSRQVHFVHWIDADRRHGHIVRERHGRIVCAMTGIRSEERIRPLGDCEVLHPDAGCHMRRLTARDGRPEVPANIMRLKDMCEVADLYSHAGSRHDDVSPCFVCTRAGNTMKCCLCLQVYHPSCLLDLLQTQHDLDVVQLGLTLEDLPECFADTYLCNLCVRGAAEEQ